MAQLRSRAGTRHKGRRDGDYMPDFSAPKAPRQTGTLQGAARLQPTEHTYPTPTRHVTRGITKPLPNGKPRVLETLRGPRRTYSDAELAAIDRAEHKRRMIEAVTSRQAQADTWANKS